MPDEFLVTPEYQSDNRKKKGTDFCYYISSYTC